MTAGPVGHRVAATARAPGIRRPGPAAAGPRPGAQASNACRQGEVELVDVDRRDLAHADDVVVADALIQAVSLRRQVEYRRGCAARAALARKHTQRHI